MFECLTGLQCLKRDWDLAHAETRVLCLDSDLPRLGFSNMYRYCINKQKKN